jgi:hypothetical protein
MTEGSSAVNAPFTMDIDEDRRQPKQLGDGQWQFVQRVRGAIKKDHVSFFRDHDWKHILPLPQEATIATY